MNFEQYAVIARAFIALLDPLVEVVIHNISTKKIVFIEGLLSKRQVGDPSLLDEDISSIEPEPYEKLNFDGRLLRSVSIPLKENGQIIGLMCINYDTTMFQELNKLTTVFLGKPLTRATDALFKNDWQERIHKCIHEKLKEEHLSFTNLTQKDKKELIYYLDKVGAFSEKNAADYIAAVLQLSRATVFNHLRICRKESYEN